MEQSRSAVRTSFAHGYSEQTHQKTLDPVLTITKADGAVQPLDMERLRRSIAWASRGYEGIIDAQCIVNETLRNIFDGVSHHEVAEALILATSAFIEQDPAYGFVASRLLFKKLFKQVTKKSVFDAEFESIYQKSFVQAIQRGAAFELYDARVLEFDLEYLAQHLRPERDGLLDYMGLRTLYERYFVKHESTRLELPQAFWMRVAMGLCYHEPNKNERAIEFYNVMSQLHYVPGTPTLLHSSLTRPQLSSCFLTTVEDDLHHIFKCLGDNAQLSKWSGGVANDWSNIRAVGSMIKSIKTESQGVIPFLKINNAVTAAINRSGKRRAATVVYLETWHMEVEDFLDLRKNTGDERRRAHDINTAHWVPDLFMKRVLADEEWTLFSPEEVPDLHHTFGKDFEKRYLEYEEKSKRGEIALFKSISATGLWRKMLSRLFETGHPWITFKDACNVRSPQDHVGVIHSSNLCTEITLNTSVEEVAVCNLGSVNLARMVDANGMNDALVASTVTSAVRMLDNVIDINFYPIKEAQTANMRHRPIGLGVMGLQDALYQRNIPFDSQAALEAADQIMEKIAYHAILASTEIARERGTYESYKGSKWDRGYLPQDTIALLEAERDMKLDSIGMSLKTSGQTDESQANPAGTLDWAPVRAAVKAHGVRNSNLMAIAPTATISTIAGTVPSIEPIYKNMYVKANMSGEFTVVNSYLIQDLKKLGLWNGDMLDQLKYHDGRLDMIRGIPDYIKAKYQEAFDIDPVWLLKITAARGKWIDQSQSHNVFMKGVSGKQLHDIYMSAWKLGLKTTYYLRTLGASQIEKSTLDAKKFGFTQKREYGSLDAAGAKDGVETEFEFSTGPSPLRQGFGGQADTGRMGGEEASEELSNAPQACSLSTDPECDVCQ